MNKKTKAGFTLIELLVVVLIIGILAAVAVPQYTQAVNKSRAVQAITMLKAITNAQEIYYLANGKYTDDLSELDIEVPNHLKGLVENWNVTESDDPNQYIFICTDKRNCHAWATNPDLPSFEFIMSYNPYPNSTYYENIKGRHYCKVTQSYKSEKAKKLCQSLGSPDPYFESSHPGQFFLLN